MTDDHGPVYANRDTGDRQEMLMILNHEDGTQVFVFRELTRGGFTIGFRYEPDWTEADLIAYLRAEYGPSRGEEPVWKVARLRVSEWDGLGVSTVIDEQTAYIEKED